MLKILGLSEDLLSESSHLDRAYDIGSHLDLVYKLLENLFLRAPT